MLPVPQVQEEAALSPSTMGRVADVRRALRRLGPPVGAVLRVGGFRVTRAGDVRVPLVAPSSFLFLVVRMLLVVRPGALSSVLAPMCTYIT